MIDRFRHYVEHEPWEERVDKIMDSANRFCRVVAVLGMLYFVVRLAERWLR